MNNRTARAKYEAPKLVAQQLRELPSALATSAGCRPTPSKGVSCSLSGTGGKTGG